MESCWTGLAILAPAIAAESAPSPEWEVVVVVPWTMDPYDKTVDDAIAESTSSGGHSLDLIAWYLYCVIQSSDNIGSKSTSEMASAAKVKQCPRSS
jgi:hypothetical protein